MSAAAALLGSAAAGVKVGIDGDDLTIEAPGQPSAELRGEEESKMKATIGEIKQAAVDIAEVFGGGGIGIPGYSGCRLQNFAG